MPQFYTGSSFKDYSMSSASNLNGSSHSDSAEHRSSAIQALLNVYSCIKQSFLDGAKGTKKHCLSTLFAVALFFVASYFNTFCQVWVQNRVIDAHRENVRPLLDAGFEYLPDMTSWRNLPDIWVTAMAVSVLFKTFFRRRFSCVLLIIKRYLIIHSILFFLRGISITITILPNPWEQCRADRFDNIFLAPFKVMIGHRRTCYDVLYSGHSCAVTLTTLIWIQYETNTLIQLLWIPVAICGYVVLVATHFHYSIDVMFGAILTLMVWGVYHYTSRRLRFLAMQRFRVYGDFNILSPFSEAKPYDAYTSEEKEYLSKLDVKPEEMSCFGRFTHHFHNQHSLSKLLFTKAAVQFFKFFECWAYDLDEEAMSPLLPLHDGDIAKPK